jgi:phospholipid/cholesterol/gamma-HCH transport system substrate-binding protein
MSNRRHTRAGIVTLALLALLVFVAVTHQLPLLGGAGGPIVRAEFSTADDVNTATPVRVGGVDVGHVQSIEPGPGHSSIVAMQITTGGVVAKRDASAQVAWRTLLGGALYVDLAPGSPSTPPLGNRVIPLSRTGYQVTWDDYNSQFTPTARLQERNTIRGFAQTLASPRAEGHTVQMLGPDLAVVGRGVAPLRGEDIGDLRALVRSTAATMNALARNQGELGNLVYGADRTLAVTARERADLGQTLALTPPALSATTITMRRLNVTLDRLDPLAINLRPGVGALAPAMDALSPALTQADRTLSDARALLRTAPTTLRALRAMGLQGVPLIAGLTPTVARLNQQLLPFLSRTDPATRLRNYEAIGPFVSALDSAAGEYEADGYFVHFMTGGGPDSVLLPCDTGLDPTQHSRCNLVESLLGELLGGGGGKGGGG